MPCFWSLWDRLSIDDQVWYGEASWILPLIFPFWGEMTVAQSLLLALHLELLLMSHLHGVIKPWSAVCKAKTIPTALSLQPLWHLVFGTLTEREPKGWVAVIGKLLLYGASLSSHLVTSNWCFPGPLGGSLLHLLFLVEICKDGSARLTCLWTISSLTAE